MRVAELSVFPLKSARGRPVDALTVEARGFAGDRRWMLVDPKGRFVSQRELPALARLSAVVTDEGLRLTLEDETIEVARPPIGGGRLPVRIWSDTLELPEATDAATWLTARFERPLRLVHQPDDAIRLTSRDWGLSDDQVGLADSFPILVATAASLRDLERQLATPLGMERFRPNLVIEGATPWAEDGWARLRIGGVELDLVKPCVRCVITTVDQRLGVVTGEEPLAGLRRLRRSADRRVPGVLFGWNAAPRRLGTIAVGDSVEVVATRSPWPVRPPAAA